MSGKKKEQQTSVPLCSTPGACLAFCIKRSGNAKVAKLDDRVIIVQKQVIWIKVSVDYVSFVQATEGIHHLLEQLPCLVIGEMS